MSDITRLILSNNKSAVILVSSKLPNLFTAKKILETDCKVKGIVICEKKGFIYRLKKELRDIKKYGLIKRISQLLLSFYIKIFNLNNEKKYLKICYKNFNKKYFFSVLNQRGIDYIFTSDYQSVETINFIKNKSPDFLLSHTPYWIGKNCYRFSSRDNPILSRGAFCFLVYI